MDTSEPLLWPIGTDPSADYSAEEERLATLASFAPDELTDDPELKRIAQFAAQLCGTESAAISLVEAERQLFIASTGLTTNETPRSTSFCAKAMLKGHILEVPDASEDPRFRDYALVTGPAHLRFYAGAPLISHEGAALGSLCVIDSEVRPGGLSAMQRDGLLVLAEAVKRRLTAHRSANEANAELKQSAQRLQFMLDSVPDIAWSAAPGPEFDFFNARFGQITGESAPADIDGWRAVIHPEDFDATLSKFSASLASPELFEDEWRLKQADGSYRYVLSRAIPSTDDPETARWFGTLTDIHDSRRIREERELLAGELAHRIKNIFSVVIGLININARGNTEREAFAELLSSSIRALSRAQEFALQMDRVAAEDLRGLLKVLMAPYGVEGESPVQILGDQVPFGPRAATPLALVFHELATNSAKYGALSTPGGTVAIAVSQNEGSAFITWHEAGGPEAKAPDKQGFGSRLITLAITHQLGGSIEHTWHREGLRTAITLPLDQLAS